MLTCLGHPQALSGAFIGITVVTIANIVAPAEQRDGMGSGCDAVGRAVASNTRKPGFESSHQQLLLNIY